LIEATGFSILCVVVVERPNLYLLADLSISPYLPSCGVLNTLGRRVLLCLAGDSYLLDFLRSFVPDE